MNVTMAEAEEVYIRKEKAGTRNPLGESAREADAAQRKERIPAARGGALQELRGQADLPCFRMCSGCVPERAGATRPPAPRRRSSGQLSR